MKIILPNFNNNYIETHNLIEQFTHQNNFIIDGIYGSFPFSFFSSENNNFEQEEIMFYGEMSQCLNSYERLSTIILDFANPYIEEKDYHNRYCSLQLEFFASRPNVYISVGQLAFAQYINEYYPEIKLILNLDFMDFDENLFNVDGVISSDISKMNNLNVSKKIYHMPLYTCAVCNHRNECIKRDQTYMLEYSQKTMFNSNCKFLDFLVADDIVANIDLAINNDVDAILFEPPKIYTDLYYQIITQCLKENGND